jgi:transposase
MATRSAVVFSDADRRTLAAERYQHPDPRVQRRMEVLWLLSQGETQARAGQLAGVSKATAERYVAVFRRRGVPGLREFHWVKPVGASERHRSDLEPEFRERPPHTVAEAIQRIEALTGVRRKETQVRAFLKKVSA